MKSTKSLLAASILAVTTSVHAPNTRNEINNPPLTSKKIIEDHTHKEITTTLINTGSTISNKRFDSQLLDDIQSAYIYKPTEKHLIDPHTRRIVGKISFFELYDREAKNFIDIFPVGYEVIGGQSDSITLSPDHKTMSWGTIRRNVEHETHQDVYDMARYILKKSGNIQANIETQIPAVDGTSGLTHQYYRVTNDSTSYITHTYKSIQELTNLLVDHDISQDLNAKEIYLSNYTGATRDHIPPLDSYGGYNISTVQKIFTQHNIEGLIADIFSIGLVMQESALDHHALSIAQAQSYRQMTPGFQSIASKYYHMDKIDMNSLKSQAKFMALHLKNIETGIRDGALITSLGKYITPNITKLHQSYMRLHTYRDWIDDEQLMAWIMTANHHNGAISTDAAIDSLLWQIDQGYIHRDDITSTIQLIEYITLSQRARNIDRNNQQKKWRDDYADKHQLSTQEKKNRGSSVRQRKKHSALYFWKTLGLTLLHEHLLSHQ